MEGLEFLKGMGDQQKQIIAQNKELADLIKQHLARPVPAPVVDHELLAKHLAELMGDPEGRIKQASSEFGANVKGFLDSVRTVPKSVGIRGQFWGFTDWKPFALHYLVIALSLAFGILSWRHNSDNEIIKRLQRDRIIVNSEMEVFKEKHPKYTKQFFPEYMNIWDETKLWWKKINDL